MKLGEEIILYDTTTWQTNLSCAQGRSLPQGEKKRSDAKISRGILSMMKTENLTTALPLSFKSRSLSLQLVGSYAATHE